MQFVPVGEQIMVIGHHVIITENFADISTYDGFAKVDVSPPRGLYHPVLPKKGAGKLMFALCGKCIETQQSTNSVEDRKLRGTWQTDELKKGLSLGYSLIRIHEVWHFKDMAQYDPKSKTGGLFAGYINTFLKLKQEASGWPKWCDTDAKKINTYQSTRDTEVSGWTQHA